MDYHLYDKDRNNLGTAEERDEGVMGLYDAYGSKTGSVRHSKDGSIEVTDKWG